MAWIFQTLLLFHWGKQTTGQQPSCLGYFPGYFPNTLEARWLVHCSYHPTILPHQHLPLKLCSLLSMSAQKRANTIRTQFTHLFLLKCPENHHLPPHSSHQSPQEIPKPTDLLIPLDLLISKNIRSTTQTVTSLLNGFYYSLSIKMKNSLLCYAVCMINMNLLDGLFTYMSAHVFWGVILLVLFRIFVISRDA